MKTITFYSYKGGVGRSLALANVANRLSEFGKKVCILDFDLEAPGQHLKFANYIFQPQQPGLVDYIHAFITRRAVPENIENYVTKVTFSGTTGRSDIDLIAAGNTREKTYWQKLSEINWNKLFYEENSTGVAFFLNLKEQIRAQLRPDFLLIDSRTGITDISGITMSIFADEVVLLAANNRENIEGIGQVIKTLAVPGNSLQNKIPKINFILSRIPFFPQAKDKPKESNAKNQALRYINNQLAADNINDLRIGKVLVIHSDPELELKEEFKISYGIENANDATAIPIGLDYLELFEELTAGMITPAERVELNQFIQFEQLIEKANANADPISKIRILESALKLNSRSSVALSLLGQAYFDIRDYSKTIESIDQALTLNPGLDINSLYYKGSALLQLKKYEEAKPFFEHLLKIDPEGYVPLIQLGSIYYVQKDYKKAMHLHEQLIALYPENAIAWNAYGNNLRVQGRFEEAIEAIYHALECDPQNSMATGTLAEIYAGLGNFREFYKNLELSFTFGMDTTQFQRILEEEEIYRQFYRDEKFLSILSKYNIDIEWTKLSIINQ